MADKPLRRQLVEVTPHVEPTHPRAIMVYTEHVVLSRTAPEARKLAADLIAAADKAEGLRQTVPLPFG